MSLSVPELSLIIPTYNESENIIPLLNELRTVLGSVSHELIVVDDQSPDGTGQLVSDYSQQHSSIRLVQPSKREGLSASVIKGFEAAQGQCLGVMDADFSHPPELMLKLLAEARAGASIALGSRRIAGGGADHWPWYRRFLSWGATRAAQIWLGFRLHDPMSGAFVLRREAYDSVKQELNPKGYKILLELVIRGQLKDYKEVAFVFRDRKQGHSKLTGSVAFQYLQMLWDLRSYSFPFHLLRKTYHTGRYKKVVRFLNPGKTLDIGCGKPCETMPEQSFLRFLNRPGSVGLDIKSMKGPYEFHQGSITKMPFPDATFDNVVAMEVFEHITEVDQALNEVFRILKPGGVFVMSTPNSNPFWDFLWHRWTHMIGQMWHEAHVIEMGAKGWTELVQKKFVVSKLEKHWLFDLIFSCRKPLQ